MSSLSCTTCSWSGDELHEDGLCPSCGSGINEKSLVKIVEKLEVCRNPVGVIGKDIDINPFRRYFYGWGFCVLIVLQLLTAPIWLLAIIVHPVLVPKKLLRVLVSVMLTILMIYLAFYWDLLMMVVYVISFGFIKTGKAVILGYTKTLYSWITSGGTDVFGCFWCLE